MDVKMNRNMGRVLLATACAAALTVGTAVPAFAVNQSGTTSVTYSSSQQVPGTNGWGFEIPTSIPFGADKSVTVDASVNLYNTTPGGSVDQITTLPAGGAKLWLESAVRQDQPLSGGRSQAHGRRQGGRRAHRHPHLQLRGHDGRLGSTRPGAAAADAAGPRVPCSASAPTGARASAPRLPGGALSTEPERRNHLAARSP